MRYLIALILLTFILLPIIGCTAPSQGPPSDADQQGAEPQIEDDGETSVVETEPVQPFDPLVGLDEGNAETGREFFYGENRGRCLRCHNLQGEGEPTCYALDDAGLRRDREWLAVFLHNPRTHRPEVARMPPFRGDDYGATIADVVAFLMTLQTPVEHPEPTDVKPADEPDPHYPEND